MLNVLVDDDRAGTLFRVSSEHARFGFQYEAECPPQRAVSLSMPVVMDQYLSEYKLHPVFDMNLPEGALGARLRLQFRKALPHFDDMTLLGIIGQSQMGRMRFRQPGQERAEIPAMRVADLLVHDGAQDLFEHLLDQYAAYSGISGVQPKVLVRDADTVQAADKVTCRGATHIVKAWNPQEYPELATNEFFCMRAALHAGIPVPAFDLSESGKFLVVERFDLQEGRYLGLEDFCVLSGKSTDEKYDGTYESIARRIRDYVSPQHVRQALDQYFKMLALSFAVRNGDAHLKNFAVLYVNAESPVWFAPAFDIVTTTVYVRQDKPALLLNGKKTWPKQKELLQFARMHCDLPEVRAAVLLEEVAAAVHQAAGEMVAHAMRQASFGQIAALMLAEWEAGLNHSIQPPEQPVSLSIPEELKKSRR